MKGNWKHVKKTLNISNKILVSIHVNYTAQKRELSIKDFFRKCDQCNRIWSHLLKKFLMESVSFSAVLKDYRIIRGVARPLTNIQEGLLCNNSWCFSSVSYCCKAFYLNLLSTNPTKWSNMFKQFVGKSRQIDWLCLTILCGWRLKC